MVTMTRSPARPVITDAIARDRYEAHLDRELAGVLEYKVTRGRIALIHTEVLPVHEGRGVGSALVRFALDDAHRRELRVIATCPYVKDYLTRHPEAADVVVRRGRPAVT
jgi:uncharacterized protein